MTDVEIEISKLNIGSSKKKISCLRIGKELPTSDRNTSLQFCNNVKALPIRTFEFTHILVQSISNDISDSISWKDKDSLYSKEETSLDTGIKLTSNSCSLNNCTKTISYKSIYVNYNIAESKYPNLDQLGFEISNLQDNCIGTTRL